MLTAIHNKKGLQAVLGLVGGTVFGFLLHKGGVTDYDVILRQLLLTDFTVVKIMLTAIIVGMIGVYILKGLGLAKLQPKAGSVGMNIIGGLIFGVAFALLGYCPGTAIGAVGRGSMDALIGGFAGMMVGAGIFAAVYPKFSKTIITRGHFGDITFPQLLKTPTWIMVTLFAGLLALILYILESFGL